MIAFVKEQTPEEHFPKVKLHYTQALLEVFPNEYEFVAHKFISLFTHNS